MAAIVDRETSEEGETRELLAERIKRSAERISGHYRMLRKFWRYYLTNSDSHSGGWRRERDRDEGADWRADLFVPASFSVIETAVPRAVFALFGSRPYVKARARERMDHDRAEAVENMLDYDFEQSKIIQMAVDFFKSFYIFGTAVCRVDYHQEFYELEHPPRIDIKNEFDEIGNITSSKTVKIVEKEPIMRYDGPKARIVSLFDFFPDPMFDNIHEMRYVGEREESTVKKLERENEQFKKLNPDVKKPKFKNLDKIKPYAEGKMTDLGMVEDFRQDTDEIMRFNYGYGGRESADLRHKDKDAVVLYHYWEDDRYVVMANGHTIIRDDKNPYNDKRKPYIAAPCFPTLKEFYGQGLLAPIQYLQEELNTLRNIALDQGKLNLYGVWAKDEGVTLSDADLAIYPGKVISTEFQGGRPGIEQIFSSTLPSDYERLENRVQSDIQSTLAINDYMIGAGGGSAGTASEAAMLNASAANRFRLQALIAQEKFVVELADMFLSRRQQFLHEPMPFRVLGEQGYDYPVYGPEEIWGRFDFEPQGSQAQPNKEVLRQQIMQLLPVAAGNPATMSMTNWPEVYKEMWSLFDFRHPQRFILPPPEKQISQKQENYIILQGEQVAVDPNENHEQHLPDLMEILPEVMESQDERVMQAFEHHRQEHQKHLDAMQQAPGGGQTPGQMGAAPGNQPNMDNQNIPSMPQMQAAVMGGPGGPVT